MKRSALLFLLLLISCLITQAQEFQGIATYYSASSLKMKLDSTRFSSEQQKVVMSALQKQMQKEFELIFSRDESIYKEVESLDRNDNLFSRITGSAGPVYKNLSESRSSSEKEFFGKLFLVKDSLKQYDWKITNESKKIGSYNCFKATAEKVIERMDYSPSGKDTTKTAKDTLEIIAWFTPQIPVSNGPAEFGGLPGLIMEIQNGNTKTLCTQVILNPKDRKAIVEPSNGKVVTQEEFEEIVEKKLDEMQEMYGGDGESGRGSTRMKISR